MPPKAFHAAELSLAKCRRHMDIGQLLAILVGTAVGFAEVVAIWWTITDREERERADEQDDSRQLILEAVEVREAWSTRFHHLPEGRS